jgi:hypothetical protein
MFDDCRWLGVFVRMVAFVLSFLAIATGHMPFGWLGAAVVFMALVSLFTSKPPLDTRSGGS